MVYNEKAMWEKFKANRNASMGLKFALKFPPENMTKNDFINACEYMHGDEIACITGSVDILGNPYLRLDPKDAIRPNGGRQGKYTTLSGIYWMAAVGKMFPERSLAYNREHIKLTVLHEKHHLDVNPFSMFCHWSMLRPVNRKFARYCEETYCDIMAAFDMAMYLGIPKHDIVDIMNDRCKFVADPAKNEKHHPSRNFRRDIVVDFISNAITCHRWRNRCSHYGYEIAENMVKAVASHMEWSAPHLYPDYAAIVYLSRYFGKRMQIGF